MVSQFPPTGLGTVLQASQLKNLRDYLQNILGLPIDQIESFFKLINSINNIGEVNTSTPGNVNISESLSRGIGGAFRMPILSHEELEKLRQKRFNEALQEYETYVPPPANIALGEMARKYLSRGIRGDPAGNQGVRGVLGRIGDIAAGVGLAIPTVLLSLGRNPLDYDIKRLQYASEEANKVAKNEDLYWRLWGHLDRDRKEQEKKEETQQKQSESNIRRAIARAESDIRPRLLKTGALLDAMPGVGDRMRDVRTVGDIEALPPYVNVNLAEDPITVDLANVGIVLEDTEAKTAASMFANQLKEKGVDVSLDGTRVIITSVPVTRSIWDKSGAYTSITLPPPSTEAEAGLTKPGELRISQSTTHPAVAYKEMIFGQTVKSAVFSNIARYEVGKEQEEKRKKENEKKSDASKKLREYLPDAILRQHVPVDNSMIPVAFGGGPFWKDRDLTTLSREEFENHVAKTLFRHLNYVLSFNFNQDTKKYDIKWRPGVTPQRIKDAVRAAASEALNHELVDTISVKDQVELFALFLRQLLGDQPNKTIIVIR